MHLHFWLACEFFIFIVFCRNGLTSPSKWASRIRFNGTDCSYWIIFLPLQRVCHRMKCLITFLNLYSRKTRSGRFYLESRTWQTTFYHKISVCKQFQGDCRFLTTGQEYEGNALLLFKCWNLGSLLGKRILDQMLSISVDTRHSNRKGEGHGRSVSQIRGWWATDRLVIWTFFQDGLFYCDSMSAWSTDDIFFVFSWQFAMLCTVPITKP